MQGGGVNINAVACAACSVPFHLEHKTAQTLIFEAKVRSQFPVLGSLALQAWIKARIMECEKELEVVKKELAVQEEKKKSQDLKSRGKQPMVCATTTTTKKWKVKQHQALFG
ncbi:hypothetical protein Acr_00g0084850 [Actinidia rufa]|uniref:Uncharacterized protein n=1 Tax=Actinidia rufa TaxID=165716 RepID=A0A7J0DVM2_9ERIC|nr:hypothetical protein Acr_00g0084850 [Actinidia rufa]